MSQMFTFFLEYENFMTTKRERGNFRNLDLFDKTHVTLQNQLLGAENRHHGSNPVECFVPVSRCWSGLLY